MHKDSEKFIEDIVEKVRKIKPGDRLEDGSVEISVADNDIKTILNKKVLRGNIKSRLEEDLKTAGLEAKIGVTNTIEITIPKDKIDTKVIKYSDLDKKSSKDKK